MSNETDLDWLARNVHVWPEITPQSIPTGDRTFEYGCTFYENHICIYHKEFANSRVIYKNQWLSRRAELRNKPSFSDHPDAKCFAQNSDGSWYKHTGASDARHINGYWVQEEMVGGVWIKVQKGETLGDWRDTLEKRPKQAEFEPFVSVEDANPKFPRDVDYVGKINAATAKQPAPKGSGNPILGMVLADLTNRALEGKEKYGEPLLAHNGRNPLWDAYQEALDLAMYLRQAIEELG